MFHSSSLREVVYSMEMDLRHGKYQMTSTACLQVAGTRCGRTSAPACQITTDWTRSSKSQICFPRVRGMAERPAALSDEICAGRCKDGILETLSFFQRDGVGQSWYE